MQEGQEQNKGDVLVRWHAAEYIAHNRKTGWYITLVTVSALLSLFLILLGEWFSVIIVAVMTIAVWVYAQRTPDTLQYHILTGGVQVGAKFYPYEEFRSFSVIRDENWFSVELEPTRRFMPRLSMFLNPQGSETVVSTLEQYLPYEERKMDVIDKLSRHLKF